MIYFLLYLLAGCFKLYRMSTSGSLEDQASEMRLPNGETWLPRASTKDKIIFCLWIIVIWPLMIGL